MNTVTIFWNAVDPSDYTTEVDVEDVCEYLAASFPSFPETAKIYHQFVAESHDVTPRIEPDIAKLQQLEGHFYVVVWPEDPVTIGIIVAIALAVVAIGLAFLLRPNTNGQNESSPNNELSDRQNKPRPNERIPDIVGTVRSVPDLIALPYKMFVDNEEYEVNNLLIGRGYYQVLDCKDSTTPVDDINGEYVAVYPPGMTQNSVSATPQATFGIAPTFVPPIVSVQKSNSVNGQVLRAPNSGNFESNNNIAFKYGGQILCNDSSIDFNDYFVASTITQDYFLQIFTNDDGVNASDPSQIVHSFGLAGTYKILSVTSNTITLSNPAAVNSNWNTLATFGGQQSTYYHTFKMSTTGDQWVGPFVLSVVDLTEVWCNVVAEAGLYYIDTHGNQKPLTVTLEVGVQAIDAAGAPVGNEIFGSVNISGSSVDRNIRGATLRMELPTSGAVQVRMKRLTPNATDTRDSYSQEIKWRDLYAASALSVTDFGNVTTAVAITAQTQDALSIKERKINMLVTRKLPTWINRTASGPPQFSTTLHATNNAADIICALALDPWIGRRELSELNVPQIYGVADAAYLGGEHVDGEIATYFGSFLMTEFCYTFADSKISFEESVAQIGQAINCIGYRSGSTINLSFEKKTSNSKLLFNHRNKLPDSETRTVTFGQYNDNDGIEYNYVDPNAPNYPNVDTPMTLYFPADQSAVNPRKIDSVGVRNYPQAYMNASRMYQKLLHTNTQTEFEATHEAAMCLQQDRILVADNTSADIQDGQVRSYSGLTVTTSQPLTFVPGQTYTAFFQLYDGSVEAIGVTPGTAANEMVLATAPTLPLVVDLAMFAQTVYWLVSANDLLSTAPPTAFLLQQKDNSTNTTYKLTATNYDDRFYDKDQALATSVIDAPPSGYGPQGFTGNGLITSAGTTYVPPARTPFNSTTYTGSSLYTQNNPSAPVTTAPSSSPGTETITFDGV